MLQIRLVAGLTHNVHVLLRPLTGMRSRRLGGHRPFLLGAPMVALLLAIEAAPMSEFANLSSLTEAYEEPVVIPSLKGAQGVSQWH